MSASPYADAGPSGNTRGREGTTRDLRKSDGSRLLEIAGVLSGELGKSGTSTTEENPRGSDSPSRKGTSDEKFASVITSVSRDADPLDEIQLTPVMFLPSWEKPLSPASSPFLEENSVASPLNQSRYRHELFQ